MALLASVKSDAQGQFTATHDAIGAGPVLVRATYQGVSFNAFLPPGRPQVDVEVFDVSKDPKTIVPASHVIIFQPRDGKLIGAEEYNVKNDSKPAVAYFRTEGNFEFAIPDKATLQNVTATGSLGMDVPQASIDKGKGRYRHRVRVSSRRNEHPSFVRGSVSRQFSEPEASCRLCGHAYSAGCASRRHTHRRRHQRRRPGTGHECVSP